MNFSKVIYWSIIAKEKSSETKQETLVDMWKEKVMHKRNVLGKLLLFSSILDKLILLVSYSTIISYHITKDTDNGLLEVRMSIYLFIYLCIM